MSPTKLTIAPNNFFTIFVFSFKNVMPSMEIKIVLVKLIAATWDELGASCSAAKNITDEIAYTTDRKIILFQSPFWKYTLTLYIFLK